MNYNIRKLLISVTVAAAFTGGYLIGRNQDRDNILNNTSQSSPHSNSLDKVAFFYNIPKIDSDDNRFHNSDGLVVIDHDKFWTLYRHWDIFIKNGDDSQSFDVALNGKKVRVNPNADSIPGYLPFLTSSSRVNSELVSKVNSFVDKTLKEIEKGEERK